MLEPANVNIQMKPNFGIPQMDVSYLVTDFIEDSFLNTKLIEKHNAVPLTVRDNRLLIAIADPDNFEALEDFKFNLGYHAEPIQVDKNSLDKLISELLQEDLGQLEITEEDEKNLAHIDTEDDKKQDDVSGADDAPIVVFLNKIMTEAIRKGASDLHFEPYENEYRIRFRIDGMLHTVNTPPVGLGPRLSARIKVMSRLDLAERRLPQDGRIKLKVGKKTMIDFRVSTLPTLYGEKVVMRILDSSAAKLNIDILGFSDAQKDLYLKNLHRPQGMILVTGPTGSGKTVSLYTGLNILNTEERNISTAEDPVEINLPGINQVQIHPKAGLSFASALRAFLRQDPDIVMVGEIRDLETAEIAVKAAQTGHLVMSTLHTNSAAETLTRMLNMGVPAYNIASSVNLIMAQRLCRKLCPKCRQPESIPHEELLREGFSPGQLHTQPTIYRAVGCDDCTDGYKGRVGLYELMPMSKAISDLIMNNGSSLELEAQANREGMVSLRHSGLLKVLEGVTSLAEVNRVTIAH
ncbi:type IV-A pilus assembly ATPase PilB [Ferrimonas balearica DSM 9799]|uniref:Type IV-A pilus assembly ATPase PilB n=1 Tax=Ferrimonas balearica (strain DSM 9799 / CCM 4581 / KCTC 23876 / PAT) TaxID=550540 RepID=E1SN78_FERBD|nr:type IV-A pilus assembly ATPase PilB [Ferrimonas balearica]ADN74577.1 type IV-A pilus assembly ATPase PilB [Ferrimonas balearica DSM 9799]